MMRTLSVFLCLGLALPAFAAVDTEKLALKMVPKGTLSYKTLRYGVKTAEDTILDIDFDNDGNLMKVSGGSLEKDELNLGKDRITFQKAVTAVRRQGRILENEWDFERVSGKWVYIFSGRDGGQEKTFHVDAQTGIVTLKD